jgi:uncharacterized protein YbaA (DUF1428 family)
MVRLMGYTSLYIVFRDRAHRDEVNAKVMSDPRLKCGKDGQPPPFDFTRMAYGGFKPIVALGQTL